MGAKRSLVIVEVDPSTDLNFDIVSDREGVQVEADIFGIGV